MNGREHTVQSPSELPRALQQKRKKARGGERGRILTIEQREEQREINIQLLPCLTRETEAAVVLLPFSFQAHLTGSRKGTPARSDVIIYMYFSFSPVFPLPSFRARSLQLGQGNLGLSHTGAAGSPLYLWPPFPLPSTGSGKQTHQPSPKSLFFQKKKKKKNTKHSDKPRGSPEEVSRHARLSVCVCPSLSRSSSETARLACKTLRHVTLLPASFGSVTRTTLLDRRAQAAFKEETQFTKIRELGCFNQGTTRGCQWVAGRDSPRASGCMDGGAITPLWGHTGGRGAESKPGKTLTISAHQVPLLPLGRGGHGTM
ncbi:uncharacterized protein LOC121059411 [Cygnus olor]|uniref:uncharacterized protein LOC121059411 n=1 Tax=Cygnus olor TaxID=8869 RepID=UPI001ADDF98C|nr:uncharacterized protein LOC121059411 [Cygnus olor]XP_040392172.1 uncharacterized protein LOC121059411 [Cygnus olor]